MKSNMDENVYFTAFFYILNSILVKLINIVLINGCVVMWIMLILRTLFNILSVVSAVATSV